MADCPISCNRCKNQQGQGNLANTLCKVKQQTLSVLCGSVYHMALLFRPMTALIQHGKATKPSIYRCRQQAVQPDLKSASTDQTANCAVQHGGCILFCITWHYTLLLCRLVTAVTQHGLVMKSALEISTDLYTLAASDWPEISNIMEGTYDIITPDSSQIIFIDRIS